MVNVSAHSAGAYCATLLVMVNVMKASGHAPPPSPAWANFTLMMQSTPENSRCYSLYTVVQGGVLGGYKSAPVSHKHMLPPPPPPSFSSPLINEDLPAGRPQLVFNLNNRLFCHQACYSLLPAKPGGPRRGSI